MGRQRNLFSDRSSLVLRTLLTQPGEEWVVRDFLDKKISLGQANKTLNRAEELGYVARVRRGRNSFARLKSREALLKDWSKFYNFSQNPQVVLFDQGGQTLAKIGEYFKKQGIRHALTAFSASRLISPYVLNREHYLYADIRPGQIQDLSRRLQEHLGFLKLAEGGNIRIAAPYYRTSVFQDLRTIEGHPVVSDLQIFLDLAGLPAGQDEIRHLKETFKKRGERFV